MNEAHMLMERGICNNNYRRRLMWIECKTPINGHYIFPAIPISFSEVSNTMSFAIDYFEDKLLWLSLFQLYKLWRCWTSEPTEGERNAIPWMKLEDWEQSNDIRWYGLDEWKGGLKHD